MSSLPPYTHHDFGFWPLKLASMDVLVVIAYTSTRHRSTTSIASIWNANY